MFTHRLALALHRTVGELERTMSAREWNDWQRFEQLHQLLPDQLGDLQNALLCSLVVSMLRSDGKPAPIADFYCIRQPAPPPPDDGLDEIDRLKLAWRGGL